MDHGHDVDFVHHMKAKQYLGIIQSFFFEGCSIPQDVAAPDCCMPAVCSQVQYPIFLFEHMHPQNGELSETWLLVKCSGNVDVNNQYIATSASWALIACVRLGRNL